MLCLLHHPQLFLSCTCTLRAYLDTLTVLVSMQVNLVRNERRNLLNLRIRRGYHKLLLWRSDVAPAAAAASGGAVGVGAANAVGAGVGAGVDADVGVGVGAGEGQRRICFFLSNLLEPFANVVCMTANSGKCTSWRDVPREALCAALTAFGKEQGKHTCSGSENMESAMTMRYYSRVEEGQEEERIVTHIDELPFGSDYPFTLAVDVGLHELQRHLQVLRLFDTVQLQKAVQLAKRCNRSRRSGGGSGGSGGSRAGISSGGNNGGGLRQELAEIHPLLPHLVFTRGLSLTI
jgi:uncharacterized membrane protein YgcG